MDDDLGRIWKASSITEYILIVPGGNEENHEEPVSG
jgi:hypothetical protein